MSIYQFNSSVLLSLLSLILLSCGKTTREEKYDSGNPKLKYEVVEKKDGSFLKDGYYKRWYENGQIGTSGQYDDNKEAGDWKWYYNTGKIKSEASYKDGLRTGVWKEYYENGQLISETPITADETNGIAKSWYSDGQKQSEYTYVNGKRNGLCTTWNADGSLKTLIKFEYDYNVSILGIWSQVDEQSGSSPEFFQFLTDGTFKYYYNENDFRTGSFKLYGTLMDLSWTDGGTENAEITYMDEKKFKLSLTDRKKVWVFTRVK